MRNLQLLMKFLYTMCITSLYFSEDRPQLVSVGTLARSAVFESLARSSPACSGSIKTYGLGREDKKSKPWARFLA